MKDDWVKKARKAFCLCAPSSSVHQSEVSGELRTEYRTKASRVPYEVSTVVAPTPTVETPVLPHYRRPYGRRREEPTIVEMMMILFFKGQSGESSLCSCCAVQGKNRYKVLPYL